MVYLASFQSIRPRYIKTQEDLLLWIEKAHLRSLSCPSQAKPLLELLEKIKAGTQKIQTRGTQLRDLDSEDWGSMSIFRLDQSKEGLGLKSRTELFNEEVLALFQEFYPEGAALPHHLIHVTCTGYSSPSGAQQIVSLRRSFQTQVTHAYHMGCYGAFPAVQIGTGFLKPPSFDQGRTVDVVHTELCSLHMNPSLHTKAQLVIESLFADGFIKYSLQSSPSPGSLCVLSFLERIIPDSETDMSWACHDWGFSMQISKEVPFKIARELEPFLEELSFQAGFSLQDLLEQALFAIHPGGPKIIEHVSNVLSLKPLQTVHSFDVLRTCGNMSSATIPHIWEKIAKDPAIPPGQVIVSLAFGPGLTIAGALLQKQG